MLNSNSDLFPQVAPSRTNSTSCNPNPVPSARISSVFGPNQAPGNIPPDLIITSSDHVHFYTHRQRLLRASSSAFAGLLLQYTPTLRLPESSAVLNIVLHIIHGLSCTQHNQIGRAHV